MNLDMIRAARARLQGRVRRTPLLSSPFLDALAQRKVYVKAECLQHTGSFKFRGAWSALSALDAQARKRGVLAYSSGNHAQGIAAAAAAHQVHAVIVMPQNAPRLKQENTRALGADLVLYDPAGEEDRESIGLALAQERGLTLIKPYDNAQVIAGQGTLGLELAEQAQANRIDAADVLVCCGGGGLTAGMALALHSVARGLRVRPCEPEGFDDTARSLAAGRVVANAAGAASLCDAIITAAPGHMTFPIMQRLCGPGLVVSDAEALYAVAQAFMRLKIVVEPGGAVALAAALRRQGQITGDAVIVVCTGGNIDPQMFVQALEVPPLPA
ncbi:MAG: pyridoxal-phosphate dependent enzyme [Rhodobacteraceae bacterium]|nr:pyridoxal-phosphate dependent enzyme [Paracoccaceae bacterium]